MPAKGTLTREERRARREARRAKQREQNIVRAAKMHDARLEAESRTERSAAPPLAATDPTEAIECHVGCSGWYYWHWFDRFYPKELPRKDWFAHYRRRFTTVELNAPFYSWPTIATVRTWIAQAGRSRFVYTIKVSELITHVLRFEGTSELIKDFGFIADMLGPRMGCFLFQLPPSHHYTPERLQAIVRQLDHRRRNVVEFRHASWWNETVYAAFRETGTIFCSSSGPRVPDELVRTADDVYIRFHGTKQWYRHDYTDEELAVWVERIRASGARRVWAYFNNDREAHSIKNAKALVRLWKRSMRDSISPR